MKDRKPPEKKNGQQALLVVSRYADAIYKIVNCYYFIKLTCPGALEVIQHIFNNSNIV